jgi:hypothetical protein
MTLYNTDRGWHEVLNQSAKNQFFDYLNAIDGKIDVIN